MTCSHSFLYSLVMNLRALIPCILASSIFFTEHAIKNNSQNNRYPSIGCHSYRGQPLPPSVILLSTCALTPSFREAAGPLPLLPGEACLLLITGSLRQCIHQSTVRVGSLRHPNWGADGGGGAEAQDIGLLYAWGLLQLLQSCRCFKEVREEEGKQ